MKEDENEGLVKTDIYSSKPAEQQEETINRLYQNMKEDNQCRKDEGDHERNVRYEGRYLVETKVVPDPDIPVAYEQIIKH